MMIARWQIEVRFGHKQTVIESLKNWQKKIAKQIGWTEKKVRILTGSIGALESTVEVEVRIKDLKELDDSWSKLAEIEEHKQWSKDLESYIVSGTPNWKVFRVIKDY